MHSHSCYPMITRITMASEGDSNDFMAPRSLKSPPPQPNGAAIRKFVLPAILLWIGSPILSLIDTATVGLSAPFNEGATQLAALGPSTTFCDGTSYLFAFLNVATTNLYAAQMAKASTAGKGAERDAAMAGTLHASYRPCHRRTSARLHIPSLPSSLRGRGRRAHRIAARADHRHRGLGAAHSALAAIDPAVCRRLRCLKRCSHLSSSELRAHSNTLSAFRVARQRASGGASRSA